MPFGGRIVLVADNGDEFVIQEEFEYRRAEDRGKRKQGPQKSKGFRIVEPAKFFGSGVAVKLSETEFNLNLNNERPGLIAKRK